MSDENDIFINGKELIKKYFLLFIASVALTAIYFLINQMISGGLSENLCKHDCYWYLGIIDHGYQKGEFVYNNLAQSNWAFFPLYPEIQRGVVYLTGLRSVDVSLYFNIILYPLFLFLCLVYYNMESGLSFNFQFLLFFSALPFNIWYHVQYSELTFGILFVSILILLRGKRSYMKLAALLCFLISLSRPTGFLFVMILSIWRVLSEFWIRETKENEGGVIWKSLQENFLLLSAGGAGVAVFVFYLYSHMGDGFAFLHVETAWARRFRFFPFWVVKAFKHKDTIFYGLSFLCAIPVLVLIYKNKFHFFVSILFLIVAASSGLMSIERYFFALPIVMIALVDFFLTRSSRERIIIFLVLISMNFYASWWWVNENAWFN